jgi:large subunit ribosomal protein L23
MSEKIIIKPIISEKSMRLVSEGQYMFEVGKGTSKTAIAQEVHRIFGVDVDAVRVHVRPGKTRRVARQRRTVRSSSRRFAIVSLAEGQRIAGFDAALDMTEEVSE